MEIPAAARAGLAPSGLGTSLFCWPACRLSGLNINGTPDSVNPFNVTDPVLWAPPVVPSAVASAVATTLLMTRPPPNRTWLSTTSAGDRTMAVSADTDVFESPNAPPESPEAPEP